MGGRVSTQYPTDREELQSENAALRGELARLQQERDEFAADNTQLEDEVRGHCACSFTEDYEQVGECAHHLQVRKKLEAAESALSAQQAQIRALVEKWQADATRLLSGRHHNQIERQALERCSHEISALLIPETP